MEQITVDATNQSFGRLASKIAELLRGKHLATYQPNITPQIEVVVKNIKKIKFFLSQIHSVISFGTLLVVFILGYALISFIWMKSDIKPYVLPILNKIIKNK